MWHQQGHLDAFSLCGASSSGWVTCPDGFCPEVLHVCPATAMAAQTYVCHEELFQGLCYPSEVSALLNEFSEHRVPEQGINHSERSGNALLRISPQLSQLFMSFLTRLSLWQMRQNVFPKTYKELNNLASKNLLQKIILHGSVPKWICRSSKALWCCCSWLASTGPTGVGHGAKVSNLLLETTNNLTCKRAYFLFLIIVFPIPCSSPSSFCIS